MEILMSSTNRQSGRSAAVTGAGGGLGRDIALGLAAKGYVVFGTAMSAAEVQDLKEASKGRVSLTVCDMTKEESVKAWAGEVYEAIGESGLDVLINNAGILTPGPIEILPLDAIRREFDVNVFGALSVINAFLPALRKARGRIVQVSTWTASVPLPFNGPSGASKAAMEVFSAVYRAELKSFGIDVVVAPAGNMKTGGPAKTASALARVANGMTPDQRALYGRAFDTFATTLNRMQNSGLDAVSAATRVIELAEQVPAPSRAAVGPDAEEMLRAAREKSDAEVPPPRLQPAQPPDRRRVRGPGAVFRTAHSGASAGSRGGPQDHRRRRLRVRACELPESSDRRPCGHGHRRCRYLPVRQRWKGRRALGHPAGRRRPDQLGPVGRPEHPSRQSPWHVLRRGGGGVASVTART